MSLFEDEVEDFVIHMKHKLLVHKNKGGFDRLSSKELLKLLRGELKELETSLEKEDNSNSIRECADIANYAMFIANKIQNRREV